MTDFKKQSGVVPESLNHPAEAMQIEEQMSKFPAKPFDPDWIAEVLEMERRRLAVVDAVFEEWPYTGWLKSLVELLERGLMTRKEASDQFFGRPLTWKEATGTLERAGNQTFREEA